MPSVLSWAVPRMAESSQCGALASQKTTVPGWTAAPLAVTCAVSVTVVPAVTEADDRVMDVTVGVGVSAWEGMQMANAAATVMINRVNRSALMMSLLGER